ncbi:hypothetical protein LshimejAT787_0113090 [Lyophyllum shimeji]|uniref:Uncharacterized protein n=1 Tax=Lyophyllum shimeji TaxID=47721 RepID=A0A9P3PEF3_LYOSH|nr:hypothetical protein LshimejAT787_0113090 [Lyophyllum shimeji]
MDAICKDTKLVRQTVDVSRGDHNGGMWAVRELTSKLVEKHTKHDGEKLSHAEALEQLEVELQLAEEDAKESAEALQNANLSYCQLLSWFQLIQHWNIAAVHQVQAVRAKLSEQNQSPDPHIQRIKQLQAELHSGDKVAFSFRLVAQDEQARSMLKCVEPAEKRADPLQAPVKENRLGNRSLRQQSSSIAQVKKQVSFNLPTETHVYPDQISQPRMPRRHLSTAESTLIPPIAAFDAQGNLFVLARGTLKRHSGDRPDAAQQSKKRNHNCERLIIQGNSQRVDF